MAKRGISKLLSTIATGSPQKVNVFLAKYRMPAAQSVEEAIAKMKLVINRNGDNAMYDLAAIHPDKDLIVRAYLVKTGVLTTAKTSPFDTRSDKSAPAKAMEISYEACGCSAEGGESPNKTFLQKEVKIGNALIYGAIGLIALTLFVKVIKS
jgi:hypothetical protein